MHRQQFPHRPKSHTTLSNTKRAALGDTAGRVAPAWRSTQPRAGQQGVSAQNGAGFRRDPRKSGPTSMGSKIFMSQLPTDSVQEADIELLFQETIGPVYDVFIVYNSQGRSKGMAVVHFQRASDAADARKKFNGKIIDGRRPMKIEIISDTPEQQKTLAQRLGDPLPTGTKSINIPSKGPTKNTTSQLTPTQRPQWRNLKKGPRRLKKSIEQLDREMEAYRAEAPQFSDSTANSAVAAGHDAISMQE